MAAENPNQLAQRMLGYNNGFGLLHRSDCGSALLGVVANHRAQKDIRIGNDFSLARARRRACFGDERRSFFSTVSTLPLVLPFRNPCSVRNDAFCCLALSAARPAAHAF
jgi:hypothetical protein